MAIAVELETDICSSNIKHELLKELEAIPFFGNLQLNKKASNQLVFVSCVHGPRAYAYLSYISLASLFRRTDLQNYVVIVYCTEYLQQLVQELLAPFRGITIKVLPDICEHLDLHKSDMRQDLRNTHAKMQILLDDELKDFQTICMLDADLLASGNGGSFKRLHIDGNQMFAVPINCNVLKTVQHQTQVCNAAADKFKIYRNIKDRYKLDIVARMKKLSPTVWYNNCICALPSKLLTDSFYELIQLFLAEPFYCDETLLLMYQMLANFELADITTQLENITVCQSLENLLTSSTTACVLNHGYSTLQNTQQEKLAFYRFLRKLELNE